MNSIAIIPARGGSKGIPGKNLMDFCGKPLLVWTIEQALSSRHISRVFVSSDDPEILRTAEAAGAAIIQRPKSLARDTSSSEEALSHALAEIGKSNPEPIDTVVFLQVTSPTRTPDDIDRALERFVSTEADSLFSAVRLDDSCIWESDPEGFRSVTFDYKHRGMRQDRRPCYLENGSIYIFKPGVLENYGNRLGGKIEIYEMEAWQGFQIDTLQEVEICSLFMRTKILHK